MRKIAFVGAQGTGKTSLVSAVAEKLRQDGVNAEQIEEAARRCPLPIDEKGNFATQFYILSQQINEENLAALRNPDVLLTDRCILDSMAYWSILMERMLCSAGEEEKLRIRTEDSMMQAMFRGWIGQYDTVIHVKTSESEWLKRNLSDGRRSTDPDWYKLVSERFGQIIKENCINAHEIITDGTPEESLEKAMEIIAGRRETEAKFPIKEEEISAFMKRAELVGFHRAEKKSQSDTYFSASDGKLRVREEENRAYVTYKSGKKKKNGIKSREETEVSISRDDANGMRRIIERLGMKRIGYVRKERLELRRGNITVSLDDVRGCGKFVEVEIIGTGNDRDFSAIERISEELGLGKPTEKSYFDLANAR